MTCKDVLHSKCRNPRPGSLEVLQQHQERTNAIGQEAEHSRLAVETRRKATR